MTFVLVKILHLPAPNKKQEQNETKQGERELIMEFVLCDHGGLEASPYTIDTGKAELPLEETSLRQENQEGSGIVLTLRVKAKELELLLSLKARESRAVIMSASTMNT